jgi:hypothetical protein
MDDFVRSEALVADVEGALPTLVVDPDDDLGKGLVTRQQRITTN